MKASWFGRGGAECNSQYLQTVSGVGNLFAHARASCSANHLVLMGMKYTHQLEVTPSGPSDGPSPVRPATKARMLQSKCAIAEDTSDLEAI